MLAADRSERVGREAVLGRSPLELLHRRQHAPLGPGWPRYHNQLQNYNLAAADHIPEFAEAGRSQVEEQPHDTHHHSHPEDSPALVGYIQKLVVGCNCNQSYQLEQSNCHGLAAVVESAVDRSNHSHYLELSADFAGQLSGPNRMHFVEDIRHKIAETCYTAVMDQDRIQAACSHNRVVALEEHQRRHPNP